VNIQPTQESGEILHTVQTGDTLAAISAAYGVPQSEILELNGLTREQARFLRIGQQLIISEGDPNAVAPTEEEPDDTEESSSQSSGFASPTPREVAQESTSIPSPTSIPTEETTEEPTPDATATPTEIPATPTDAPTAPVEQGED